MGDPLLKNHADMMLAVEAGYDYAPNIAQDMADRIEELEAENKQLRIMLDSYGRLSTHKTPLTELRGVSREADEYVKTKTRAAQVKGQTDE